MPFPSLVEMTMKVELTSWTSFYAKSCFAALAERGDSFSLLFLFNLCLVDVRAEAAGNFFRLVQLL
jgi:hypothetical protein